MSLCTITKARLAKLAVCVSSLAVFGACGNSPQPGLASAKCIDASSGPGTCRLDSRPPGWYKGRAPIIRFQLDEKRNREWVLAWDGVHMYDRDTRQVVGGIALPGWSWVGKPYGCSPALAIGPQGEGVVTSDVYPVIWRVDPTTLAATWTELALDSDADKDMGFPGLVYAPELGAFIAIGSFIGSFWRIEPSLRHAQKISMSSPLPRACGWDISLPARGQRMDGVFRMCISNQREARQINMAPDLRSAVVGAQVCERRD